MRLVVAIVTQKQLIVSARIHCFLNNSVFFLLKSNFSETTYVLQRFYVVLRKNSKNQKKFIFAEPRIQFLRVAGTITATNT